MRFSKTYLPFIAVALITTIACTEKSKLTIEPLPFLDTILKENFKGKILITKFSHYKVFGYKYNKENLKYLDNFIEKYKDRDLKKYHQYDIVFYLPSDEKDSIQLKHHPDRYYNLQTTISDYMWLDGKLASVTRFKDGEIIGPTHVVIKDLPLDKGSN